MEYVTLEWRRGHAAHDIQDLLSQFAAGGWRLHTVLPGDRVLILERALDR